MTATTKDFLRTCVFSPYRKGMGPRFRLRVWDTHRTDSMGKSILGYSLFSMEPGTLLEIFQGEDFHCSPMHCVDSDETITAIMGFLTLKPGDTDAEYFEDYSAAQLEYCEQHAESLYCEVMNRFGVS